MSEETPTGKKKRGPAKQTRGQKHKQQQREVVDITPDLHTIDQDEAVSKKAKLDKLLKIRANCLKSLNDQQQEFVKEYFVDFNVTKAGIRAGYTKSYSMNGELMKLQAIVNYIEVTRKINELRMGVTADFVVAEFNKLAKVKASDLYDNEGELIPPHKLPDWVAAAISEVKQKSYTVGEGETQKKVVEFSYKLHSKVAALDALGKHTGVYERDNKQKTPPASTGPQVVFYIPENGREVKPEADVKKEGAEN